MSTKPEDGGTVTVDFEEAPQGKIAHIRIDHAERRNAIGPAVVDGFQTVCANLRNDADVRIATLSGVGRTFAAGANVKVMARLDPDGARDFIASLGHAIDAVRTLPFPVIAIMRGHAVGAAMELAAACDMRIADTTLITGMPEVRVGIPSVIQASLLPRLIGWGKTSELLLTGRDVNAREAKELGFLERLTAPDELDHATREWIDATLACEPAAIRAQKAVMLAWNPDAQVGIPESIDAYSDIFRTGAPTRAMAHFIKPSS